MTRMLEALRRIEVKPAQADAGESVPAEQEECRAVHPASLEPDGSETSGADVVAPPGEDGDASAPPSAEGENSDDAADRGESAALAVPRQIDEECPGGIASGPSRPSKTPRLMVVAPPGRREPRKIKRRLPEVAGQYDELVARILRRFPPGRPAVVGFADCFPSGPSGLLAPLAVALAEEAAGDVLAVDANFHKPTLAERLGATPVRRSGTLLDVLSAAAGWRKAVRPTTVPRLHVLPGKKLPPDHGASPLSRFPSLLDELRGDFPWIALDLGWVAREEAAHLAGLCDGTYLFVMLGRTGRREARQAIASVHTAGGRVVGSILVENGPARESLDPR